MTSSSGQKYLELGGTRSTGVIEGGPAVHCHYKADFQNLREIKLLNLEGIGLLETSNIFSYNLERTVSREACILVLEGDTAEGMGCPISSASLPHGMAKNRASGP